MIRLLSPVRGIDDAVRDQLEWFEDFGQLPPTFALTLEPVTAGANADDDVAATLVGVNGSSRPLYVVGGYECVSANSAGIDANNTSAWVITSGGVTLITKTNAANLVEDTPVSLGTPTARTIGAGGDIQLAITNGTAADLNSAVCHVGLEVATEYPAAGMEFLCADAGASISIADGVKGVVALATGAVDNNEVYVGRNLESLKFLANKPIVLEAYLQFTDTNSACNVIFGAADALAADLLLDTGGGPKASYSGAVLFKVDGGTKWCLETSIAGTQTTTTSVTTAGGSSYQRLRIEIRPISTTVAEVTAFVDGVQLTDAYGNLIKHRHTYTSATEMQLVAGIKAGEGTSLTLNIDSLGFGTLR